MKKHVYLFLSCTSIAALSTQMCSAMDSRYKTAPPPYSHYDSNTGIITTMPDQYQAHRPTKREQEKNHLMRYLDDIAPLGQGVSTEGKTIDLFWVSYCEQDQLSHFKVFVKKLHDALKQYHRSQFNRTYDSEASSYSLTPTIDAYVEKLEQLQTLQSFNEINFDRLRKFLMVAQQVLDDAQKPKVSTYKKLCGWAKRAFNN